MPTRRYFGIQAELNSKALAKRQQRPTTDHAIAVEPPLHKRVPGAAQALVLSVKRWAVEAGATRVKLNVVEKNERAKGCYERAGFRATGRRGVVEKKGDVEMEMICDVGDLPG